MADAPGSNGKAGEEEDSVPAAIAVKIPSVEESAPVGPSSDEEAAFLSADREAGFVEAPRSAVANTVDDSDDTPLPPMDDLVKRIPAPARELIETLFRARFVTVKRLPKAALKKI